MFDGPKRGMCVCMWMSIVGIINCCSARCSNIFNILSSPWCCCSSMVICSKRSLWNNCTDDVCSETIQASVCPCCLITGSKSHVSATERTRSWSEFYLLCLYACVHTNCHYILQTSWQHLIYHQCTNVNWGNKEESDPPRKWSKQVDATTHAVSPYKCGRQCLLWPKFGVIASRDEQTENWVWCFKKELMQRTFPNRWQRYTNPDTLEPTSLTLYIMNFLF